MEPLLNMQMLGIQATVWVDVKVNIYWGQYDYNKYIINYVQGLCEALSKSIQRGLPNKDGQGQMWEGFYEVVDRFLPI